MPRQERGIAMEFFGIGMPEFMMILVIAIVIFGPDKIPQMASQVGKAVRDFRRYTNELTKEFNDATGGLKDEFANIASDIRGELAQAQADLRSQLDLTDVLNMNPTPATVAAAAAPAISADAPVAETPAVAAADSVAVRSEDPAPAPTINVMTPYAESLAAESTPVATNGHAAEPVAAPIATKADPFADLAVLTLDGTAQSDPIAIAVNDGMPALSTTPEPVELTDLPAPIVEREAELVAATNGANGHAPRVGGSVAGSRYARRRSA
jgi:sec-independent protein translocase protein TatA